MPAFPEPVSTVIASPITPEVLQYTTKAPASLVAENVNELEPILLSEFIADTKLAIRELLPEGEASNSVVSEGVPLTAVHVKPSIIIVSPINVVPPALLNACLLASPNAEL